LMNVHCFIYVMSFLFVFVAVYLFWNGLFYRVHVGFSLPALLTDVWLKLMGCVKEWSM
jgi:hypothetical protein